MIGRSLVLILLISQSAFGQSAHPIFDRLSKLRDVSISNPLDTQVLTYDLALGKWKNATGGGGGGISLTGENYLSLAGSVLTANAVNLGGTNATGTLAAAREPAHTGDVTNSAGSLTLTLGNIPDLVTQSGSILATNIAAPTTPTSGKTKVYVDSTSKNIAAKNDAGTVNHGIQSRTATASNWIRLINDDGSTGISQPAFTDISGAAIDTQVPDILTISKISNLTTNGVIQTKNGDGSLEITNLSDIPASGHLSYVFSDVGSIDFKIENTNSGTSASASLNLKTDFGTGNIASIGKTSSTYNGAPYLPYDLFVYPGLAGRLVFPSHSQTFATAASLKLDSVVIPNVTTSFTGTTSVTTATGLNKFSIYKPTYTDSSAAVVTRGATLYIEDAPAVSGSLTLTNPYALWIDNGIARFDGGIKFTEAAPASGRFVQSGGAIYNDSAYALPTAVGTAGKLLQSNGTDVVSSTPTWPTSAGTSGKLVQSDGTNLVTSTPTWPTSAGTSGYEVQSDGTNFLSYPNDLVNAAVTNQTGFAADTYVTNSLVTVTAGDFKVKGTYHVVIDMTKTAAGVATPILSFRIGTLGTTGDAAVATLTFNAQTAAADSGTIEAWATFRTVGSGTSAVLSAWGRITHVLAATGLSVANVSTTSNTGAGFNSTTATKIGVSFNGGASFAGTCTGVFSELRQP